MLLDKQLSKKKMSKKPLDCLLTEVISRDGGGGGGGGWAEEVLTITAYAGRLRTYVQDWTQLPILQILRLFVLVSNLTNFAIFR